MPELPEVQTTVDGLNKKVRGKTIASLWCNWPRLIRNLTPLKFAREIMWARILNARRRGKNIFIDLDNEKTIHVHMKMTGHLLFGEWHWQKNDGKFVAIKQGPMRDDPGNRFIRFMITFKDGSQLALCDMRKFAKIGLYSTNEIEEKIGPLGLEPLDESFTKEGFFKILANNTTRPIKQFLLDQTKIAGIGNIYSDEMLWRADIHPLRKPGSLTKKEVVKLYEAMQHVLLAGLNFGGDSNVDYRNIEGLHGRFQNEHQAYRRTGKPCGKRRCKGTITRIVVGARSTHFCNLHQRPA